MQCEKCKSHKATVFLTQIVGGKMQKVDLCEGCAKQMGVTNCSGFSLADLLLNMGADVSQSAQNEELACPSCGYTENELKKTGRLGCSDCYDTFYDTLHNVLKDTQKALHHKGKIPRQHYKKASKQRLKDLEKELLLAVDSEKYEEAAWLRDQIRILKETH